MALLTPTEKLLILESKCLPKKEVERIASVLRSKFRFSINRPNSELIDAYLEKVVIDDGKVDRGQEYIRRIAKILDNSNTELVAKEIERILATKGVYEFKVPANLLNKAKELAKMIVDNGFSYKEFAEWLEGAKAFKNDADDIMRVGDVADTESLYTQLLGIANESSAGKTKLPYNLKKAEKLLSYGGDEDDLTSEQMVDAIIAHGAVEGQQHDMIDWVEGVVPIESQESEWTISDFLDKIDYVKPEPEADGNSSWTKEEAINYIVKVINAEYADRIPELSQLVMSKSGELNDIADKIMKNGPSLKNEIRKSFPELILFATTPLGDWDGIINRQAYEAKKSDKFVKGFVKGDEIVQDGDVSGWRYVVVSNGGNTFVIGDNGERKQQVKGKILPKNLKGELSYSDIKGGKVQEARMQIKRPYKRNGIELSPAITVQEEAATRNRIVKFLGEQPLFRASKNAIREFYNTMNEDIEGNKNRASSWLYRNTHLVKKIRIGKESFYKLTRAGLNLFNKINKQVNEDIEEEDTFKITDLLNIEAIKQAIADAPEDQTVSLIPNYSINVQSKYEDGEELQYDLDDLETTLGCTLRVNDYDELVADPHGVLDESVNESTIKTIEDRDNAGRKYEFFKTPSGRIEYQVYDWDDVDGDWAKAGQPSDDIDWLIGEENPEINAFLEKQGIKVGEAKSLKGKKPVVADDIEMESLPPAIQELIIYADALEMADWEGGKGTLSGKIKGRTIFSGIVDSAGDKLKVLELTGKRAGKIYDWDGKSEVKINDDPHTEEIDEAKSKKIDDKLVPYYIGISADPAFKITGAINGGKGFAFETVEPVPHHYEDGQTEIQKFEVGMDGDEFYCLFVNNGDEIPLTSPDDLAEYVGAQANEANSAELAAIKDWFSSLSDEEKDMMLASYSDESGKEVNVQNPPAGFWSFLDKQQASIMSEGKETSYELVVTGEDNDTKKQVMDYMMAIVPDQVIDLGNGDWSLVVNDYVDREEFDKQLRLADSIDGVHIQAFKYDAPIDLRSHKEMVAESADHSDSFTVEKPTKQQMTYYMALQSYLKRHYHAGKDYNFTSSGTLRIKKAIQEKLMPYLSHLDMIQPTND